MDGAKTSEKKADVVLGEDWVGADAAADTELRAQRGRRGLISINRSPLARKIITFNLLAILVLGAGVLFLNPFRESLVFQRERGLVVEASLIAEVFEAQLPRGAPVNLATGDGIDIPGTLAELELPNAVDVFVYDQTGGLIATTIGQTRADPPFPELDRDGESTAITDVLNAIWDGLSGVFSWGAEPEIEMDSAGLAAALVPLALEAGAQINTGTDP
ncbi:MAG: sensor N-terminal transmembrane domain-containing protein, partial [Pseudomonadota bacterium]